MNKSFPLRPEDTRFGASVTVSSLELSTQQHNIEHRIYAELRMKLADAIVHKKIEKAVREFTTEYRVVVHVLSDEHLFELIQQEAHRLSRYLNPPF